MSETDEDLFPETKPRRVEITDPKHRAAVDNFYGVAHAEAVLKQVPTAQRMPGFTHALTIIQREVAILRADMMHRNLVVAAKAGVDPATASRISLEGHTLVCHAFQPEAPAE